MKKTLILGALLCLGITTHPAAGPGDTSPAPNIPNSRTIPGTTPGAI